MEFETNDWDSPFSGNGVRIIKSHTFAHHLNDLKNTKFPIILVYRNDYECMKWWLEAGGFDITYPNYKPYYKDNANMFNQIQSQNKDIMKFIWDNRTRITQVSNNYELANAVNISCNGNEHHNYKLKDTTVYVYQSKVS